jgi:NAD(P)-dependent dehydrogenase (short-subunit alcohol dehydrogenase family)
MKLNQTTALITGASRGLGRALAVHLADAGARVVLVARGKGPLRTVVESIRASGGTAWGLVGDIGNPQDASRLVGEAAALAGPIDLLVNNASTLGPTPLPLLLDLDPEGLEHCMAVGVFGPFRLTRAAAGPMVLGGGGTIVNISSDAAVDAYPRWGAYAASKAALDHMTRTWAAELEGTAVRFLAVDPGEMNTRMHADAVPEADPTQLRDPRDVARALIELIAGDTPSGRYGLDIADRKEVA